ncbi:hypothetical protein tb265_43320 [Gemmatimonadetes bacterium T265]|nr:hypothetical protein tb265_43320 [Gemmatimonadetes bacterium T265]
MGAAAPPSVEQLRARLRVAGDAGRARALHRFFQADPGGYGAGDTFVGVRVPDVRRLARAARGLALDDVAVLLRSPVHEERLLALLVLVDAYARGDGATRDVVFAFYLAHVAQVNNWDLVDASAPYVVGAHLAARDRGLLDDLAASPSVWERRIAVLATFHFVRRGEGADTLRLAARLLADRHPLIHKAVGWMLREVGKRDPGALARFLDAHAGAMPRTMLRYAVERLAPAERQRYMRADRPG